MLLLNYITHIFRRQSCLSWLSFSALRTVIRLLIEKICNTATDMWPFFNLIGELAHHMLKIAWYCLVYYPKFPRTSHLCWVCKLQQWAFRARMGTITELWGHIFKLIWFTQTWTKLASLIYCFHNFIWSVVPLQNKHAVYYSNGQHSHHSMFIFRFSVMGMYVFHYIFMMLPHVSQICNATPSPLTLSNQIPH